MASNLSFRIYQVETTGDPPSLNVISSTVRKSGAGTTDPAFVVEELGDLTRSVEYEDARYMLDSVSARISGLPESYFAAYETEANGAAYRPFVFEVRRGPQGEWASNEVVFHGVVDPDSPAFAQRTGRQKIKVWSWDRLLAQAKKVPARVRSKITVTDGITADENFHDDEIYLGTIESDKVQVGDVAIFENEPSDINVDDASREEQKPNYGERRFTVGDIRSQSDGDGRMDIAFVAPRYINLAVGETVLNYNPEENAFILPLEGNQDIVQAGGQSIAIQLVDANGQTTPWIQAKNTRKTETVELFGETIGPSALIEIADEFGFIIENHDPPFDIPFVADIEEGPIGGGDPATLNVKFIQSFNPGETIEFMSGAVYGYDPGTFEAHRVATTDGAGNPTGLIPALFSIQSTGPLELLSTVVDTYVFPESVEEIAIDRRMDYPDSLEDALRQIARTAEVMIEIVPAKDGADPAVDVRIIPRTDASDLTPIEAPGPTPTEWSDKTVPQPIQGVIVKTKEVSKPTDYGDVLGWYPQEAGPEPGDDEEVVEIDTLVFPAYTAETDEEVTDDGTVNDAALKEVAKSYFNFFSDLGREGQGQIAEDTAGLILGRRVTFPDVGSGGRTVFVKETARNLTEGKTKIKFRRGTYAPAERTAIAIRTEVPETVIITDADAPEASVTFDAADTAAPAGATFSWEITAGATGASVTGNRVASAALPEGEHSWKLTVTAGSTSKTATGTVTVIKEPFTNGNPASVSYDAYEVTEGGRRKAILDVYVGKGGIQPEQRASGNVVDFYVAEGRSIPDDAAPTGRDLQQGHDPDDDGTAEATIYRRKVTLSEAHTTAIKAALQFGPQEVRETDPFVYDADSLPDPAYTWEWVWSGATEDYTLYLSWDGTVDTKSVVAEVDTDRDGTYESVVVENKRNARVAVANSISGNQTIDAVFTAYNAEQNAADGDREGVPQEEPRAVTITSPPAQTGADFSQAEADARYLLEGEADKATAPITLAGGLLFSDGGQQINDITTSGPLSDNPDHLVTESALSDLASGSIGGIPVEFGRNDTGIQDGDYVRYNAAYNEFNDYDPFANDETVFGAWTFEDDITLDAGARLVTDGATTGFSGGGTIIDRVESWFEDLSVRGRLLAQTFEVRKTSYSRGPLVVGLGGGQIETVSSAGFEKWKLTFAEAPGIQTDDLVLIQESDTDDTDRTIIKQIELVCYSTANGGKTIYVEEESGTDAPEKGDDAVVIGNEVDAGRDSLIWLDPYEETIDVVSDIDSHFAWNNRSTTEDSYADIEVRLGDLAGVTADVGGVDPSGYGLWSDNAFLKNAVISGQIYVEGGNAATLDDTFSGDYGDITGSKPPADADKTSENTAADIANLPDVPDGSAGYFNNGTRMGFHDGAEWTVFMEQSAGVGNFYLRSEATDDPAAGDQGLLWDGSTGQLTITGAIRVTGGNAATQSDTFSGDYGDLFNKPSFADIASTGDITETYISDDAITTPKVGTGAITADEANFNDLNAVAASIGSWNINSDRIQRGGQDTTITIGEFATGFTGFQMIKFGGGQQIRLHDNTPDKRPSLELLSGSGRIHIGQPSFGPHKNDFGLFVREPNGSGGFRDVFYASNGTAYIDNLELRALDIADTLTIDSGGEITNGSDDFRVDDVGFAVQTDPSYFEQRSFAVKDFADGTVYGALRGDAGGIQLESRNGAFLGITSDQTMTITANNGDTIISAGSGSDDHVEIRDALHVAALGNLPLVFANSTPTPSKSDVPQGGALLYLERVSSSDYNLKVAMHRDDGTLQISDAAT